MSSSSKITKFGHKVVGVGPLKADLFAVAANFSTLMNLILGLIISLAILSYNPLDRILAMRFLMLGASFDAIDGRLARKSNTKPKLGAQFDTIADQVTFGIAPALMILDMLFKFNELLAFMLAGMYLFGASFRLSRFMLEPTYGFFNGMPSPVAATFIAAWYIQRSPDVSLLALAIALIASVMIVSLPFTALKIVKTLFQKINFAFTIIMMLLLTYAPSQWMEFLGKIWILHISYFTLVGSYHARTTMSEVITKS